MYDCFEDSPLNSKPLVTFALFAYNQERFIREAVESALAQTYSPLEIILSDDFSKDGTFAVMEECVKNYTGPHSVVINRNAVNIGLAEHINTVVDLSKGDLIVVAAGDDISYVKRTEILVDAWLANDKPVAMCSGFDCITTKGVPDGDSQAWYRSFMPYVGETREQKLKRLVRDGVPAMIGCTEVWSKDLLSRFPVLNSDVWFEDNVLSFRSWLIGQIHYLPEQLVAYRKHETNISNRVDRVCITCEDIINSERKKSVWYSRRVAVLSMHQLDINHALDENLIDRNLQERMSNFIGQIVNCYSIRSNWWNFTIFDRLHNAFILLQKERSWASFRWILPRLLPLRCFARLKLCKFLSS
jgi:glycosyltransferase involved in cell wall biosynthesis